MENILQRFSCASFSLLTLPSLTLKMTKIDFYFMLKAIFVLKIFTILSWLSGYVAKWFRKKAKVNFKIYDIKGWTINNYNIHIVHYIKR